MRVQKMVASSEKLLTCAFLTDVLCRYRKTEEFAIMDRCLKCPHYLRFITEMDEEDERDNREIEEAFANPEKYLRGQADDRR